MRLTKQKQVLHQLLQEMTGFFNAEELYQKAQKSNIGLATIYRFLNKEEEQGQLHAFICDGRKIYSLNKTSHAHFTCEICSHKEHLHLKTADFLPKKKICHFQLDVYGVCEQCLKKTSQTSSSPRS